MSTPDFPRLKYAGVEYTLVWSTESESRQKIDLLHTLKKTFPLSMLCRESFNQLINTSKSSPVPRPLQSNTVRQSSVFWIAGLKLTLEWSVNQSATVSRTEKPKYK